MDDKLKERAKLVYERDNNSPLFIRVADYYIQSNDPHTAISILENGLKLFPEHALALILMGKAQHSIGQTELTESFFRRAGEILNNSRTFEYYKKEFNIPDKQASPFDSSRGNLFINSDHDYVTDYEFTDEQTKSLDDNLKEIAEKLMNTRIDQKNSNPLNENTKQNITVDRSKLASETFANIYLSQGQKNEAIKIYELLAERNLDKREYYLDKIRKLNSQ